MLKRTKSIFSLLIMLQVIFIGFFPIPLVNGSNLIGVSAGLNGITITTEKMTLNINNYKPDFSWWHLNTTSPQEIYCVQFIKIHEYFGEDDYLDGAEELTGISYNLLTNDWHHSIIELTNEVIVNLTLSGLANDASIQIIIHLSELYMSLNHVENLYVKPFLEARLEFFAKNWVFTPGAKGLALKSEIYESEKMNQIFLDYIPYESHNNLKAIYFSSFDKITYGKAFFKWVTIADYYQNSQYVTTSNVGDVFFNETNLPLNENKEHLWFSYPKKNDSLIVIQEGILGLFEQSTTLTNDLLRMHLTSFIIIIPFVIFIIRVIRKKFCH